MEDFVRIGEAFGQERENREIPLDAQVDTVFGNPRDDRELVVFDHAVFEFVDYYDRYLQDQDDPRNINERGVIFIGNQYSDPISARRWTHITAVMPQWNQYIELPDGEILRRNPARKSITADEWQASLAIAEKIPSGARIVAWGHTHPQYNPGPSDLDEEIITHQKVISLIDNPTDGRMAVYTYESGNLGNAGGFMVLKPKLEPQASYDRRKSYQGRSYWQGNISNGRTVPLPL